MNYRIICYLVACTTITSTPLAGYTPGIEAFGHTLDSYKTKRIGIVTNQTGITQSGKRSIDFLLRKHFNITTLFAPEHGIDGTIAAAKTVVNGIDRKTKLPIISLYAGGDQPISPETLDTIDVIFFDLQDSGMRHYTYISTLYTLLETCATHHKPIVVFDRPNPLGAVMEGPLVDNQHRSFIAIAPIPLRHAMTMGELAQYFNSKLLTQSAPLTVIAMKNYKRTQQINQLQTFLSPYIQTIQACRGYSFLGLLGEIEQFDYNTIIEKPFQCIMLRKNYHVRASHWRRLQLMLQRHGIESTRVTFPKKPDVFAGISITIPHVNHCSAFNALLDVITFAHREKIPLTFKPAFDGAAGTSNVRAYAQGSLSKQTLAQNINNELHQFYHQARASFLYKPYPRIMLTRNN